MSAHLQSSLYDYFLVFKVSGPDQVVAIGEHFQHAFHVTYLVILFVFSPLESYLLRINVSVNWLLYYGTETVLLGQ